MSALRHNSEQKVEKNIKCLTGVGGARKLSFIPLYDHTFGSE